MTINDGNLIRTFKALVRWCSYVTFGVIWGLSEIYAEDMRRALVNQNVKDRDDALEFIIRHSIPVISLEAPEDMETFKKKLRLWNPQIRDWTNIGEWEAINVYRKTPIYEMSLGYHYYDNTEKLESGGTINTTNSGPTLDLRVTFVHDLEFFSYLNYKFLKKNDFTLEGQTRLYSFPANHSFEYGFKWQSSFSNWGTNLAVGWEQYSFISFNSDRFRIKRIIERNLQVSTSEILWFLPSLDYRFTLFKRGSYLRLGGGYSVFGKKSLDDGTKEEDVKSYRGLFSWKQYIRSRWWVELYFQYAQMDGVTNTVQSQYGLYTGYSFQFFIFATKKLG